MGGACSSRREGDNEAGTSYEGLCAAVESKLGLYKIDITEFEVVLDEVSYKKDAIDLDTLSDVFVRFGVLRSEFLSKDGPFIIFYNGLVGTIEEDKGFILSASLPFCKGKMLDKKNVLWRCLMTTEKNYIKWNELIELIKMMIVTTVKIIPEMVYDNEIGNIDTNIQTLIDATEEELNDYARQYFPGTPRDKNMVHRHEFDEWLLRPESDGVFSPTHHRKSFLAYLNTKKLAEIPS